MDLKVLSSLAFLLIIIQSKVSVKSAECSYSYSYDIYGIFFKYTCVPRPDYSNRYDNFDHIRGHHQQRKSDSDVQVISHSFGIKDINLHTFPTTICDKFRNLGNITFIDAKIEKINPASFRNCKNLEALNLKYNKIWEISKNLLAANTKLEYFSIGSNKLTTLHENTFNSQHELQKLDLSDNKISFLPRNIFKPLTKLKQLYLGRNELRTLDHAWFTNLNNLASLHLYSTKITELPMNIFSPLENLWVLALEFNELSVIHQSSFAIHRKLRVVDFHGNKIDAIDGNFIDNLSAIKDFDMRGNLCSNDRMFSLKEVKQKLLRCVQNYPLLGEMRVPNDEYILIKCFFKQE